VGCFGYNGAILSRNSIQEYAIEMISVDIRELKTNLSKYLERVKQGQTLIITERGKSIARIVPEGASIAGRQKGLVLSGILHQAGSPLPVILPVMASPQGHLISGLVSEDRHE
jgi:prevent-host-death family protein